MVIVSAPAAEESACSYLLSAQAHPPALKQTNRVAADDGDDEWPTIWLFDNVGEPVIAGLRKNANRCPGVGIVPQRNVALRRRLG